MADNDLPLLRTAVQDEDADNDFPPLLIAVQDGNATLVKTLLDSGADINGKSKNGKTSIFIAAEKGYPLIVEILLSYGPDTDDVCNMSAFHAAICSVKTEHKKIAEDMSMNGFAVTSKDAKNLDLLFSSVENGHVKITEDLLKCGSYINICVKLEKRNSLLKTAIKNGQETITELLINYGADINEITDCDISLLCYAVERGNFEIVKQLLIAKADVNLDALHIAIENNHREIVKMLLEYNLDINCRDRYGKAALHYTPDSRNVFRNRKRKLDEGIQTNSAGLSENVEIAKLLLSVGADINIKQTDGMTTLHIAIREENEKLVELLLDCNAMVNCIGIRNRTPLHYAALISSTTIAKLLLDRGAPVNAQCNSGYTALHIASKIGNKIAKLFLSYNPDSNICSTAHLTAIHSAVKASSVVKVLLQCNADVNITSNFGNTALDLAVAGFGENDSTLISLYGYSPIHDQLFKILNHIIKLKAAGLYVSKHNLQSIASRIHLRSDFMHKCEIDIENMKNKKIDNFCVYDILINSENRLASLAGNENIVKFVNSDSFISQFPYYFDMIRYKLKKATQRKELLQQCHEFSPSFIKLSYDCMENLFDYLNDNDLRNLIESCKLSKVLFLS